MNTLLPIGRAGGARVAPMQQASVDALGGQAEAPPVAEPDGTLERKPKKKKKKKKARRAAA